MYVDPRIGGLIKDQMGILCKRCGMQLKEKNIDCLYCHKLKTDQEVKEFREKNKPENPRKFKIVVYVLIAIVGIAIAVIDKI